MTDPVKKARQGFGADEQYAAVKAARAKRIAKRSKNLKQIISGGYKQIPILNAANPQQ